MGTVLISCVLGRRLGHCPASGGLYGTAVDCIMKDRIARGVISCSRCRRRSNTRRFHRMRSIPTTVRNCCRHPFRRRRGMFRFRDRKRIKSAACRGIHNRHFPVNRCRRRTEGFPDIHNSRCRRPHRTYICRRRHLRIRIFSKRQRSLRRQV